MNVRGRILAFVSAFLVASGAYAEPSPRDLDPLAARPGFSFAALERPAGIAEAGVGWLTLPGAEVCIERAAGCSHGDTSLEVEVWQLYRSSRRFAFGAGILLALIPTTDAPRDPEGVERDHIRRYFTVEGMVRYYPYVGDSVEWWVGITGGLVVVSDSFIVEQSRDDNRALLGPRGVTIRTEGGTVGLAGGPVVALSPNWSAGLTLRYGHWFLPHQPARDPLGSEASLTGRNTMFSLGVSLAYRTEL
ncbi:MAG: hypothetical protein DIU78_018295 [Pseudomonadota bacterium]